MGAVEKYEGRRTGREVERVRARAEVDRAKIAAEGGEPGISRGCTYQ